MPESARAAAAISAVEERSRELRREVGVGALVLTQVMYVVGTGWVGTAAKLGPSHVTFWLLAIALFFLHVVPFGLFAIGFLAMVLARSRRAWT